MLNFDHWADREMFKQKRLSHLEAVKALHNIGGYEKQYKMVNQIVKEIFKVRERHMNGSISTNCTYISVANNILNTIYTL